MAAAKEWVEGGGGLLLIGAAAAARGLGITGDLAPRGALVEIGKGRVAAFEHAEPFTPPAWNEPFVLQVLHWLTQR